MEEKQRQEIIDRLRNLYEELGGEWGTVFEDGLAAALGESFLHGMHQGIREGFSPSTKPLELEHQEEKA
jgi:hypothetical protein